MPEVLTLPTTQGPARAHLHLPGNGTSSDGGSVRDGASPADDGAVPDAALAPGRAPAAALVLGHGAGGGVNAPDLVAVTAEALELGVAVALVEQPYRVAGRRGSPRAPTLDAAWQDVVDALSADHLAGLPLVVGGRSAGARVACRTALATHAVGALALAFPVQPPGRPDAPSRLPELDGAGVPVLVVQGEKDPYGVPGPGPDREVVVVPGDHSLRRTTPVRDAVGPWLRRLLDLR